jgi:hypothetical protein
VIGQLGALTLIEDVNLPHDTFRIIVGPK